MTRVVQARTEFDWHRKRAKPFRLMMVGKAAVTFGVSTYSRLDYTINGRAVRLLRPPLRK